MNSKQKLDVAIQALEDIASAKLSKDTCVLLAKTTIKKLKDKEEHDSEKPKR